MESRKQRKPSRRPRSTLRNRHSLADWESQKCRIVRYYVEKDMTIEATMDVMRRKHHFYAGKRAYQTTINRVWKLRKNINRHVMSVALSRIEERKKLGTSTVIRYHGTVLTEERIRRFLKRPAVKGESVEDYDEMLSQDAMPSGFSCHTPSPEDRLSAGDRQVLCQPESYPSKTGAPPNHTYQLTSIESASTRLSTPPIRGESEALDTYALLRQKGDDLVVGPNETRSHKALLSKASLLCKRGELKLAEDAAQEALVGFSSSLGPQSHEALLALRSLVTIHLKQRDFVLATSEAGQLLFSSKEEHGSSHEMALSALELLGQSHQAQGDHDAAESCFSKLLNEVEELPEMCREKTDTLLVLASLHSRQERWGDALSYHLKAVSWSRSLFGLGDDSTEKSLWALIRFYEDHQKLHELEEQYAEDCRSHGKIFGTVSEDELWALQCITYVHIMQGRYLQASSEMERLVTWCKDLYGPVHLVTLACRTHQVSLHMFSGRFKDSVALGRCLMSDFETSYGEYGRKTLDLAINLAVVYQDLGEFGDAQLLLLRAINGYERLGEYVKLTDSKLRLGVTMMRSDEFEAAGSYISEGLDVFDSADKDVKISLLGTMHIFLVNYLNFAQPIAVEVPLNRILSVIDYSPDLDSSAPKAVLDFISFAASLYSAMGKLKKADELFLHLISIWPKTEVWNSNPEVWAVNAAIRLGCHRALQKDFKEAELYLTIARRASMLLFGMSCLHLTFIDRELEYLGSGQTGSVAMLHSFGQPVIGTVGSAATDPELYAWKELVKQNPRENKTVDALICNIMSIAPGPDGRLRGIIARTHGRDDDGAG